LWSVVCGLRPANAEKNCSRVSSYPHFSKLLKYDGMKFPIALKYIPKFEMMNALSINVFTIKEEEILLLLLSKSHYTHRTKYYKLTFAWFVQELKAIALELNKIFKKKIDLKPLNLTQENDFNSATTCYICEKLFAGDKVKEHCHLTGEYEYRGAAHNSCNLNYEDSHMLPVIFHNLSGYDSHFIIKALSTEILGKINLLPINKEKYISFSKYVAGAKINFRFLDSYRFMAESIEKLSSFLPNEKKSITKIFYSDPAQFDLVTRKGVFPYEYLDNWDKLQDNCLPERQAFYSKITFGELSKLIHCRNMQNFI
jgi:hypothetical protein